jgi:hypothetical protein
MKLTLKKINTFFFKENTDFEWISFFRIAIGFLLLLHFISVLPDFNSLFSTNGIIPSDILDTFIPNYIITFPKIITFFSSFGISEIITTLLFKIFYIAFSVCLIIGFSPRVSATFLLVLQISLVKGSSFYAYGVDYFSSMSLFYLILIPSHYQYSIYTYLKRNIQISNITPYRRLFQLHLCIAYFFSGFDKVLGFNWWNGESIWKAINLPFANNDFNFNFSFLAHHSILLIIIGWATIIIEMLYPIFIWIPKTRKTWLYLTISMHLGIALILNLYIFSAIMIIWNLTNFYTFDNKQTL